MADQITDIIDILKEWKDVEYTTFSETLKTVGKEAVKELKSTSPSKTGEFRKGWRCKAVEKKDGVYEVTVYNKTKPQITHLLENGHAKIIGGRHYPNDVEGSHFIKTAEDNAMEKLGVELKIKL